MNSSEDEILDQRGFFYHALLLVLLGSWNAILIKLALLFFPPFHLGTLRMAGIALLMAALSIWTAQSFFPVNRKACQLMFCASLLKAISLVGIYAGLEKTFVVRATVIMMTSPILSVILTPFFIPEDRPGFLRWMSVLVGFAGVGIVLWPSWQRDAVLQGDLLIFLFVVFTRLLTIAQKKALSLGTTPAQLVFWDGVISVLLLFPLSIVFQEKLSSSIPSIGWWLLFLLVTLFGVWMFFYRRWLLSRVEVTFLSSFRYLDWAVTTLLALLLLGEPLPERYFQGLSLIVFSLYLLRKEIGMFAEA